MSESERLFGENVRRSISGLQIRNTYENTFLLRGLTTICKRYSQRCEIIKIFETIKFIFQMLFYFFKKVNETKIEQALLST